MLSQYIDYFVNGDPDTLSSNPNVLQASNFPTFKSTFGAGKQQMINTNSALNKINIPFTNKAKSSGLNTRYTKTFMKLSLDDDGNWVEEQNVRQFKILNI